MARRPPKLTVAITVTAQRELLRIWDYNAEHRSERAADAWDEFLRRKIDTLAIDYHKGRAVENFPELQHIVAKKRPSDFGHIIVYEVDEEAKAVSVLHVFHTRQDVRGRLKRGRD